VTVLLILAHPSPRSFNHAIAQAARETLEERGHEVVLHDLYAEGFEPLLPAAELLKDAALAPSIEAHCREIAEVDGIVVVHPNWWGQPPAVLKGWLDRVLRQGVAYRFGTDESGQPGVIGMLKAKAAVVFTTSNTPREQELAIYGDPLENLWRTCVFGFCGVRGFQRRNYEVVVVSTPEQRAAWLQDVRRTVQEWFALEP
jgi:putative NADPH-quinone reductase